MITRSYILRSVLCTSGDIPMEVLMNLPSPEEILRRVEEAKAKAAAALQKQTEARKARSTVA